MLQVLTGILLLFSCVGRASADCQFSDVGITCPSSGSYDSCEGASLDSNIIFRCIDGCPAPGNCNDDLADVPPYGTKTGAYCWQTSSTTGDAQCTADCVKVTAANGTSFYPVGCTFTVDNSTGAASAGPSSTSIFIAPHKGATAAATQASPTATSAAPGSSQTGAAERLMPPHPEMWGGLVLTAIGVAVGVAAIA